MSLYFAVSVVASGVHTGYKWYCVLFSLDGVDFYEGADGQMLSVELVGYILSMLHKCLQCDTEGFVTKEIFNMLVQPLINQVKTFNHVTPYIHNHIC